MSVCLQDECLLLLSFFFFFSKSPELPIDVPATGTAHWIQACRQNHFLKEHQPVGER